jgi:hypothetical protein
VTTHDEVIERLTRVETKLDLVLRVFGIGFTATSIAIAGLVIRIVFGP